MVLRFSPAMYGKMIVCASCCALKTLSDSCAGRVVAWGCGCGVGVVILRGKFVCDGI